jgi:hypothetical protein
MCKAKFFTQKSVKQASLRLSGEYFRINRGAASFIGWRLQKVSLFL